MMNPGDLLKQIEELDVNAVEEQIRHHEDKIDILKKIMKILSKSPKRTKIPRSSMPVGSQPAEDQESRVKTLEDRIVDYITMKGDKTFHELMAALHVMPGPLAAAIRNITDKVRKGDDGEYTLA